MNERQDLPKLKVGDRFKLAAWPSLPAVELVRKSRKTWLVAEILPDGELDRVPYSIATSSLVGKTVTLLPF